jgi:hypothetical protein
LTGTNLVLRDGVMQRVLPLVTTTVPSYGGKEGDPGELGGGKRGAGVRTGSTSSPGSSPTAICLRIVDHCGSRWPPPVRRLLSVSRRVSASFSRGDAMERKVLGGGGWAREKGERREWLEEAQIFWVLWDLGFYQICFSSVPRNFLHHHDPWGHATVGPRCHWPVQPNEK